MDRIKEKLNRLFEPRGWVSCCIVILAGLLLIWALVRGNHSMLAYLAYLFSAYALIVAVLGFIRLGRFLSTAVRRKLSSNDYGARFLSDKVYRTELMTYQGFFMNAIYVVLKLITGIWTHSVWLIALSFYYLCLTLLRYSLLRHIRRKNRKDDMRESWRRYRLCGMELLLLNIALSGLAVLIVRENAGFYYPGFLIYAVAAYTFYAVTISIINLVRFRKYGNPVASAAKVINLTAALTSLFTLETAMLNQFGNDDSFRFHVTAWTGGGVFLIVFALAVYMILHASCKIRASDSSRTQAC